MADHNTTATRTHMQSAPLAASIFRSVNSTVLSEIDEITKNGITSQTC